MQGTTAYFGVVRISRELPGQSTLGLTYTAREYEGSHNRILALDGGFRLSPTWSAGMLLSGSSTKGLSGDERSGANIEARLFRQSRSLEFDRRLADRTPGFRTQAGYVKLYDTRYVTQTLTYTHWRDDSRTLSNIRPSLYVERGWDGSGGQLFTSINPSLTVALRQQTQFTLDYISYSDVLRPQDYPVLPERRLFGEHQIGISGSSSRLRFATLSAGIVSGTRLNFVPPVGAAPGLSDFVGANASVSVRPADGMSIGASYLLDRPRSRLDGRSLYDSHIFRTTWNWQITRELAVRFIGQYDGLSAAPSLTSTEPHRVFNADFLVSYILHPGSAIYVGYNSNSRALNPQAEDLHVPDRFFNDSRQFFVKVSYLFRL